MRALAAALGAVLALGCMGLFVSCKSPPDPKIAGYALSAEICAQTAVRMDAGQAEKWNYYDACEHEAYRVWGPR